MNRQTILVPDKLKEILNETDLGIINTTASKFGIIYEDNRLYFFPEYTNHGINHIEEVLIAASELITEESYKNLESKDITALILSVILHDLGMHLSKESLIKLIEETNNDIVIPGLDKRTWKEEWQEFFHEAKRFNEEKLEQIFGDKTVKIVKYDFEKNEEYSKKLLGEFLRKMHPRLAHEISINGYPTLKENIQLNEAIDLPTKELSGLIARSHGLELRDTFKYLEDNYFKAWSSPYNIKVIYLMAVLRIADYIQIHRGRANKLILQTRRLSSSVSIQEWEKHNAIEFINTDTDDPERIYVHASPKTSEIFLELQKLFRGIQYELDISWAVLGEVYGRHSYFKKLGLNYRRIQSNLDDKAKFQKTVKYIPEKVKFDADPEILKLLIGPLYGEDPKFGIRELLQNSVDAAKERSFLEENNKSYEPHVNIEIKELDTGNYMLILSDNGVGMNKDTLINYFFRAGASFRKSDFWLKQYVPNGITKIDRVGRFGVGVLAAYLLGDEISVTTRHIHSSEGLIFNAKLSSSQIELIKTNCEIGTRIEILLKEDVANDLNDRQMIDWFVWYKVNYPKISYKLPEKLEKKFNFNKPGDVTPSIEDKRKSWRTFETKTFGKIKWSFKNVYRSSYEREKKPNTLIINGFIIPKGFILTDSKYRWQAPIVSVFDTNGMMPLSLNRNYLQNDSLPFEDELLENISKDIIAKLLSIEIIQTGSFYCVADKSKNLVFEQSINLQPNIIFINNSFTLDIPFILYKLNIDSLPLVWVKKNDKKAPNNLFTNGYISIPSNLSSISSYSDAMDNYFGTYYSWFSVFGFSERANVNWRRIFLNKEKYDYLTYGKRLRLGFKNESKIEKSNTEWISFLNKPPYYKRSENIQPKDKYNTSESSININDLHSLIPEIDLIIENKFGYYKDRDNYGDNKEQKLEFDQKKITSFPIFEKMLEKYLGPDFLIPIDSEERKIKFSEAFKDLQNEIEFHKDLK